MQKMTLIAAAGAAALFTTVPAHAEAATSSKSCGDVSIAQMNWAAAAVTTNIAKFLLEQGYGCKVSLVKSDTVPAITSVAENGSPDVVTNLWLNSAGDAYKKLEKTGKIKRVAKVLTPGGVEGWWIPTYLAKKHPELTTIKGVMAHPEWVGGSFNNCPDGWGCRIVNDNLIKALDLKKSGITVFNHGSGQTLATSIASAYADKKPWFGYYWGPTVVMGKDKMTRVKLGDVNMKVFAKLQNKDTQNPKVSDFPAAVDLTAVTSKFAKTHPAETEFFSKMTFKTSTMSTLLAWQDKNKSSAQETAVHFITTYPEVWKTWLSAPAQKKLAKLTKG
ncbi:MAG: ABC transporter substrate-binding protein [Allgaiera sp.]|jgi:glycine betaine/proline transport system substrate-binding protein|nr:ABC transporter substrate-binding protein [Allgaiera sp.]